MLCFYLLALVQIVLESFPVSSSGHFLLVGKFLQAWADCGWVSLCNVQSMHGVSLLYNECVEHILHAPTALVLALFFFNRWKLFFIDLKNRWRMALKLMVLVGIADSITTFFYVLFKFTGRNLAPVWVGFALSAVALFSLVMRTDKRYEVFTWRKALLIGFVQGVAFLPGVSRFAVTFVMARWLRLSPNRSFEISFIIFWPLIVASFFKSIIRGCGQELRLFFDLRIIVVIVCASVVALCALWFVQWLVYRKKIWFFSLYLLAVMLLWLML